MKVSGPPSSLRTSPALVVALAKRSGLPAELVRSGARRLQVAAAVLVVGSALALVVRHLRTVQGPWVPVVDAASVVVCLVGIGVAVTAGRTKLPPVWLMMLGLGFEVVSALGIAIAENVTPWSLDAPPRGISWVCCWILLYPLLVPGPRGPAMVTALLAAAMGPVAFGLTLLLGNPSPRLSIVALGFAPNAIAVAAAVVAIHALDAITSKGSRRTVGHYRLEHCLGQGGMGEVWYATHDQLARPAAVKLVRKDALAAVEKGTGENALRRFEREAKATAALRSPYTVDLFDYGVTDDGSLYYVMELLEGLDLETLVDTYGPVPPSRAVHFLRQACRSLAEAHALGLVHRDIKPSNLMACRLGAELDFVKVLDFGLVKPQPFAGLDSLSLTAQGHMTGTPAFLAPEIVRGEKALDGRADLYALGCVAYWLLTGQYVFDEPNPVRLAVAHMSQPPLPPSLRGGVIVPEGLDELVLRCLQKDRGRRPSTALELDRLLGALPDVPVWTREDAEGWWEGKLAPRRVPSGHVPAEGETPAVAADGSAEAAQVSGTVPSERGPSAESLAKTRKVNRQG